MTKRKRQAARYDYVAAIKASIDDVPGAVPFIPTEKARKILRKLVREAVMEGFSWAVSCQGKSVADLIAKRLVP